jgi:opacity protein-like surface antigen
MFKSVLTAAAAASLLCTAPAFASEEGHGDGGHSSHFYVVPKAVFGLGDKVTHGVETLDGASSTGYGLDLGYSLGGPWGVEVSYSSAKGDVKNDLGVKLGQATYTGTGVFAVYTHRYNNPLAVVAKLGWMKETEKLEGVTNSDTGVAYVLGAEYEITEKVEAVVEYEGTDIKSPKGAAVMVGAKFIF